MTITEAPVLLEVRPRSSVPSRIRSEVGIYAGIYAAVRLVSWALYAIVWQSPLKATTTWDGSFFLGIAQHGYPSAITTRYSSLAFFPGEPIVVRAFHYLGGSWAFTGFAVSLLAGGAACVLCGVLVADHYGAAAGRRAALLMSVAPGAFLFGMAYAEPLAIAFVAGTLLALDRERWVLAGVLGAAAIVTSPIAAPIIIAGLWVAWRRGGEAWLAPVIMPTGVVAFMAYLHGHTGNAAIWFHAERHGWDTHLSLTSTIYWLQRPPPNEIPVTLVVCFFLAVAGLYAMRLARVPTTWWLYTVPILLYTMFDSAHWMNPRMLLNAFPLALAAAVKVRGRWFAVLVVCSAVAMEVALVAYTVSWGDLVAQP